MFDLIAFDADDTLWHNERFYRWGRERFAAILAPYQLNGAADARADELEVANLPYYGYGVMSFVLSLVEAAIDLTEGAIKAGDIQRILDVGKEMLEHEVEFFPHAEEAVTRLAADFPLLLITKGDLRHQEHKVALSGLRSYFREVAVVSNKRPETYASILARHQVPAARFLMVGNSLRSDILPVLSLGGWAVHITRDLTWAHEEATIPAAARPRLREIAHLGQLPAVLAELLAASAQTDSVDE
jgi:putative hydrolase of the HAD superfamily